MPLGVVVVVVVAAVDGTSAAWIAVVAALGSALVTTAGATWLQSRKAKIDAEAATVAHARALASEHQASIEAATEKLMISAVQLHHFAQGMRDLLAHHSGANLGKLTRDLLKLQLDLHDRAWLVLQPAMEAQAELQLTAPPDLYEPAHQLLKACFEAVGLATTKGSARGQASSSVLGLKWTPEEEQALIDRLANIDPARSTFAEAARSYLDSGGL